MSGLNQRFTKPSSPNGLREFESHFLRQFTISEFSEVLRTCGAVASPAGEAERAEFVNWRYLLVEILTFFEQNPE